MKITLGDAWMAQFKSHHTERWCRITVHEQEAEARIAAEATASCGYETRVMKVLVTENYRCGPENRPDREYLLIEEATR
jgi:hypothetical protein